MANEHIAGDGDIGPLAGDSMGSAAHGVSAENAGAFGLALEEFNAKVRAFDLARADASAATAALMNWVTVGEKVIAMAAPMMANLRAAPPGPQRDSAMTRFGDVLGQVNGIVATLNQILHPQAA